MIRMPYISNTLNEEDFIGKASPEKAFNITAEEIG